MVPKALVLPRCCSRVVPLLSERWHDFQGSMVQLQKGSGSCLATESCLLAAGLTAGNIMVAGPAQPWQ